MAISRLWLDVDVRESILSSYRAQAVVVGPDVRRPEQEGVMRYARVVAYRASQTLGAEVCQNSICF